MPTDVQGPPKSSETWWLTVAVLLALFLQIAVVLRSPAIAPDGMTFINMAKALSSAPAIAMQQADQHPGYPALILATRWATAELTSQPGISSWILPAHLATGLFGILSVVVVWLLAKSVFSSRVAAVAAVIFAVLPPFRQNAADTLSDAPHLFFYLLSTWMAAEGFARRRSLWFIGAGTASGLAYWIRPEGLSVAIVAAALLLLWPFARSQSQPKFRFQGLAALIVATLLTAAPYPILSGKMTSKKDPLKLLAGETWKRENSSPVIFFNAAKAQVRETVHGLRYVLLAPLCLALFLRGRRSGDETRARLLGALVAFHIFLVFVLYVTAGYVADRHVFPVIALALPWIASGTVSLAEKSRSLFPPHHPLGQPRYSDWALGFIVLLFVAATSPRSLRPLNSDLRPLVEAAAWVRAHAEPGDAVLSNSPYVPFYADLPGRVLQATDTISTATWRGVASHRFVVLETGGDNFRPEWVSQLHPYYVQMDLGQEGHSGRKVIVLQERSPRSVPGRFEVTSG